MEINSISKKQLFLLQWGLDDKYKDEKALIADGSIRAGKTMFMSLGYILWSMDNFNETSFGMAGKTIASLRRNVITNLISMLKNNGYKVIEKRADNKLVISYGNITNYYYLFGGKDEASQDLVQGISVAGFYFDEVALMPQSFVNQATGRALTYPNRKYWFNCNPAGPMHYFKTDWIDDLKNKHARRLHFMMSDNPILSKTDIQDAANMYSGVFYDRYILGKWAMTDGVIYPDFSKETNMVDPEDIPNDLEYFAGVDWGYSHFGSIVLLGYHEPTDVTYLIHEINHKNREIDYWVDIAHMLMDKYGDIPFYCDSARPEHVARFQEENIFAINADKSVLIGIECLGGLIKANKFKVSTASCDLMKYRDNEEKDSFINEVYEYCWDKDKDAPVKKKDDVMDSTRYPVYNHYKARQNQTMSFNV